MISAAQAYVLVVWLGVVPFVDITKPPMIFETCQQAAADWELSHHIEGQPVASCEAVK